MSLSSENISQIRTFTETLILKESSRLSSVSSHTGLLITAIIKSADILGFKCDVNPNFKIKNLDLVRILNNIIENPSDYETIHRAGPFGFSALLEQIKLSQNRTLYSRTLNRDETKPFLSNRPLFKYYSFNSHSIDSLENSYIYHSKVTDFNDPFDCNARLLGKIMRKESYPIESTTLINDFVEHIGVACFSLTKSSILMWSHYGNRHTGFCVEYSSYDLNWNTGEYSNAEVGSFHQSILKSAGDIFEKLYQVEYADLLKQLTIMPTKKGFYRTVKHLFLTKYNDWRYEQEVRRIIHLKETHNQTARKISHTRGNSQGDLLGGTSK
jgi:hypothetical protein